MRYGRFTPLVAPFFAVFAAVNTACAVLPHTTASHRKEHLAYLDPALAASQGDVSVIVTSRHDSRAAADAVRRAGGKVTADLWIINAVSATASASQIKRLAHDPTINSIIEDKKVHTADYEGWVTDLRENRGTVKLSLTANASDLFYASAPATLLPDGGYVGVSLYGEVVIVNADGSERKRVWLPTNDYYISSPIVGRNGLVYVISAYKTVTALNPADGTQVWRDATMYNTTAYYVGNAVIGPASGNLYVVDSTGVIYAYNGTTGMKVWTQTVATGGKLTLGLTPAIDANETLYIVTGTAGKNGGAAYAVNATGVRWSRTLSDTPLVSAPLVGGILYAVAGTHLTAIDAATGSFRFDYNAGTTINGGAAVAADGSAFISTTTTAIAVSAVGQVQWTFAPPTAFDSNPYLTPDGNTVYVVGPSSQKKGNSNSVVYALNRSNGTQRWSYSFANAINKVPGSVDPDGSLLLANGSNVERFDPQLGLIDKIGAGDTIQAVSQPAPTGNIVATVANVYMTFVGRVTDQWNGRKDVETDTSSSNPYRLQYPVPVDIGADKLHSQSLGSGTYIKGNNVTCAVVDSGVYWSQAVKNILGPLLQKQFVGQADFVQKTCPAATTGCTADPSGAFAFYDYNNSRDGYGHGTHVAGTIANRLQDRGTLTKSNSYSAIGVAPESNVLSVRVLGNDGSGSYATVIQGIQYVIANKNTYGIRAMNLSISAYATVPYFVDPLDRAVERAWQAGIVVVAAAGNTGPFANTITVPGNDPYVITVGAVNGRRTSGFWKDDILPAWSATGPTFDGFVKPDVLAPGSQIVSFMYNDPKGVDTQYLVSIHPDYSANENLFRMNGTSMATAVTTGVVALMLQVNPQLTPDQVKYRLMNTAKIGWDGNGSNSAPGYSIFQQGAGRIWARDAVLSPVDPAGVANYGMDINADLAHGYADVSELAYHYQGPVRRVVSSDGTAYMYCATTSSGTTYGLGATTVDGQWLDGNTAMQYTWPVISLVWTGGNYSSLQNATGSVSLVWTGGNGDLASSVHLVWTGAHNIGSTVSLVWTGDNHWTGGDPWSSIHLVWTGTCPTCYQDTKTAWDQSIAATSASSSGSVWIDDRFTPPIRRTVPPPAGVKP